MPLDKDLQLKVESTINDIKTQKTPSPKTHWMTKKQTWAVSLWKGDEVTFLRPRHIIDDIEKLEYELYEDLTNNRFTTPRPIKFENVDNILTLIGLTESAKRDTDEVSSSLTHSAIGSDGTAAAEGDTDLTAEFTDTAYARKAFDTSGQRKVLNQTAKYSMLWDDSSFDATPRDIKEAGVMWGGTKGVANDIHAHVAFTTFTLNAGDIFVAQINELMENA